MGLFPHHSHRIVMTGGSGSYKVKILLNLIKHQRLDTDKIYIYVKNTFESKYQLLINRIEKVGIKKLKNPTHLLIIHRQLMRSVNIKKTII